jgi:hypothetical protein
MGRPKGWMQEKTGRSAMRSPGRPEINQRLTKQAFWEQIAAGLQSEDAARVCGVSQPLGPRWFREAGGIAPTNLGATSGRYLSFAEREEISLLHAQQLGVREIARQLERAPSTISRELRRNAATRNGKLQYRATVAQRQVESVCSRAACRNPTGRARQGATGPASALERASAWPAHRSTMGHQLEPAADQSPIDA